MYRELPNSNYPNSGWRFMSGDEIQEYLDNSSNSEAYQLNTICNYDSDIIPLLDSEIGKAFFRNNNGIFEEDITFESKPN